MTATQQTRRRRTISVLGALIVAVMAWAGLAALAHHALAAVRSGGQPSLALRNDARPVPGRRSRSELAHREALTPCATNRRPQLVVVSIAKQHLWACAGHRTVISTAVTTGRTGRPGNATPRGHFAVQGLNRNTTLNTSADGHYPVKYWIPFHLGVWGFHDASWQTIPFGSSHYRSNGSHGCVHMPLAAIRHLFRWVKYGTRVRIS